ARPAESWRGPDARDGKVVSPRRFLYSKRMHRLLEVFYIVFALITEFGGVMGFLKAKSRASLIAGTVSASLLFAASILLMTGHPMIGLTLGIVTSVLLAGKFIPDYMHKRTLVPGGLMALLSAASIGLTLLSWYKK